MTILKLADGSEYQLTTAGFSYADAGKRTIGIELLTNQTLDEIITAFSDKTKTSKMTVSLDSDVDGPTYEGYTELANSYSVKKDVQGYSNKISIKLSTPETVIDNEELSVAITYASENIPDELALECKSIFDNWEDLAEGTEIKQGRRLNYNGGLWKCAKTHNKQSDWYPGAEGTLFEQLDAEEHQGTLEDPIPVPDSVTTSGFTYVYGKYYQEGSDIYLCQRGSVEDPESMYGQEVKLNYAPSALIGHYFVKV